MAATLRQDLATPLFADVDLLGMLPYKGKIDSLMRKTGIAAAIASLRARGTDAHLWLPGVGTINGLQTGNYLESTGNSIATVDNPTGLVLDALGTVGTELVTNGEFDTDTVWSKSASCAISGGSCNFTSAASGESTSQDAVAALVKLYKYSYTVTNYVSGSVGLKVGGTLSVTASANGTVTGYAYSTGVNVLVEISIRSATTTLSIDNISVKEVSGIHLTQSTTANKPLLRRGLTNLLTYSSDFSNAAWVTEGTASKVGNVLNMPASPGDDVYHGTLLPAGTYTNAFVLSGSGTISLFCYNPTDNIFAVKQITLTATPTIYVNVASPTVANNVYYFGRRTGDTATSVTFGCGGLFQGTLTASQIIAAGGIPITTTAAASNPNAGKYSWSFDGSNDSLLTGNLGITNACTIVIAGRLDSLASVVGLFMESTGGLQLYVESSGLVTLVKIAVAGLVHSPVGTIVAGVPFVITTRLSGGTAVMRKNGVQVATAATALTFSATSGATIGQVFGGGLPLNGSLGNVLAMPVALTDAECLLVERMAAANFPNGPVF